MYQACSVRRSRHSMLRTLCSSVGRAVEPALMIVRALVIAAAVSLLSSSCRAGPSLDGAGLFALPPDRASLVSGAPPASQHGSLRFGMQVARTMSQALGRVGKTSLTPMI